MHRLTTAFECVPAFAVVPINRPRIPCSNCPPHIGAYSLPTTSRWRSRRYSVRDSVFQSSISRLRQSFAGASLRVAFRLVIPIPPMLYVLFYLRRKTRLQKHGYLFVLYDFLRPHKTPTLHDNV